MKKKVLLLGSTGMLGSTVYDILKDRYDLTLSVRDEAKTELLEKAYGGVGGHRVVEFDAMKVYNDLLQRKGYPGEYFNSFLEEVGEVDYAINAIGITIPYSIAEPAGTFFINSALPFVLSSAFGEKLIHITTDCVYDGKEGYPYDENSPKTPIDIYGMSKSLGEPMNCLTLRTSIIGRELEGFTGLLEWFLKQEGKEINGFTEHYWNGVTTKEFGKICDRIMSDPEKYPKTGLYHVFSTTVSKYEILEAFKDKYGIDCVINKEGENKLNRTLSTVREMNDKLEVASFDQMIKEL